MRGEDSSPSRCALQGLSQVLGACFGGVQTFQAGDVGGQVVGDVGPAGDGRGVAGDGEVGDVLTTVGEGQGDALAYEREVELVMRHVSEGLPGLEDVLVSAVVGLRCDRVWYALQQVVQACYSAVVHPDGGEVRVLPSERLCVFESLGLFVRFRVRMRDDELRVSYW